MEKVLIFALGIPYYVNYLNQLYYEQEFFTSLFFQKDRMDYDFSFFGYLCMAIDGTRRM